MKISKRILGVALALIMIFNVFAVGTFAAYTGGAAAKLIIKTDKTTYAPGEEVTISFGVHSTEVAGNFSASGGWAYGYNTDVLEFCSTSDYNLSTGAADHAFTIDASQTGFVAPMSQIVPDATVVGETITAGYDWNAIGFVSIAGSDGFVDTISDEYIFFSFKMKVKADAENGTYTIGYNPDCYSTWYAYNSTDVAGEGSYGDNGAGTDYDFGTATFTVGEAAEEKIVYHVKNQIQWADKDANTVNLGVVAGFDVEDINIQFYEEGDEGGIAGQAKNVYAVGAKVVIGEKDDSKTEQFVYAMNDGASYYFRAVIENVSADYNGNIVVTPFVQLEENGEKIYADDVVIEATDLAEMLTRLP